MYHVSHNPLLERVRLTRLRPTQLTVGYAEVTIKAEEWSHLPKKQRKVQLKQHVFPAVLGPKGDHYIVDHHHLGIALMQNGVREALVAVLDDLSWLEPAIFWRTMEFRSWSHPFDNRGRRQEYHSMPRRLMDLEDDPYRSLAGLVRTAGGFAKDQEPFVEFLWADFYRPRVPERLIKREQRKATLLGLKLARSHDARYLPGWTGEVADGKAKS